MENTPTVFADDLPIIMRFFSNDSTSRSVNYVLQRLNLDPYSICFLFTSQSSTQYRKSWLKHVEMTTCAARRNYPMG